MRSGDPGVADTINAMESLVLKHQEGASNAQIRAQALTWTRSVDSRDSTAEIQAIFDGVHKNIRFRGEDGETLQTPLTTLKLGAGDCDDHSMLLAALLQSLGYRTRFVTVAADPSTPDFTHVYTEVLDRRRKLWVSLDTTVNSSYPGWTPQRVSRRKVWRTLGNDTSVEVTDGQSIPGLSPGKQALYNISETFAQALANRLQYGVRPGVNLDVTGGTGWIWILGLGGLAWAAFGGHGRRR